MTFEAVTKNSFVYFKIENHILILLQLYKKRKIMQGRGKSGKQALNLTEEMVYEMNR